MSLYLNFRGTFTNSGGHTKSFKFLPVKLNSYPEISVHFLFKFELDGDRFGSRKGVDDSEVVSAIALVLNSPENLLLYIKIACSGLLLNEIQVFRHCCCISLVEKSISNSTFFIGKYHVHSLNCAIYFPL